MHTYENHGGDKRKIPRLLARVLLLLIACILILLASLPAWLPLVLPALLKPYGITYSTATGSGYQRIKLKDVRFMRGNVWFEGEQVEVLQPLSWLYHQAAGTKSDPFLSISNWHLKIEEVTTNKPPSSTHLKTPYTQANKFNARLAKLQRQIPHAVLRNGRVDFRNHQLDIPELIWKTKDFSLGIRNSQGQQELQAHVRRTSPSSFEGRLRFMPDDVVGEFRAEQNPNQLSLEMTNHWTGNLLTTFLAFSPTNQLPAVAEIHSSNFKVPAGKLKLSNYETVSGSLDAKWRDDQFHLRLIAKGEPADENKTPPIPPLTVQISAWGDRDQIQINQAHLSTSWLFANLSEPLRISWKGRMLSAQTSLRIVADLSAQQWIAASGNIEATASAIQATDSLPAVQFQVNGNNVEYRNHEASSLAIRGRFEWPWISASDIRIEFPETTTVDATCRYNIRTREIADGKLNISGDYFSKFLPHSISCKELRIDSIFDGTVRNIKHRGTLSAGQMKLRGMQPLETRIDWKGTMMEEIHFDSLFQNQVSSMRLEGSFSSRDGTTHIQANEFQFHANGTEDFLSLQQPFAVEIVKSTNLSKNRGVSIVTPLHLRSRQGEIMLEGGMEWPAKGQWKIHAKQLDLQALFKNILSLPLQEPYVNHLDITAAWNEGPLSLDASLDLAGMLDQKQSMRSQDQQRIQSPILQKLPSSFPMRLQLKLDGNDQRLNIQQFDVSGEEGVVMFAAGSLPVVVFPSNPGDSFHLQREAPLEFRVVSSPESSLWDHVSAMTGTRIIRPQLDFNLSGTFDKPEGTMEIHAKTIHIPAWKDHTNLPAVDDLNLRLNLSRDMARLENFSFQVEGQPVLGWGEVPFGSDFWSLRTRNRRIDWNSARGRLMIEEARIKPFAAYFPQYLSPQGRFSMLLSLRDGLNVDGRIHVRNAALRPFSQLGSIHDLAAEVHFQNRKVVVEEIGGTIGGAPFRVSGAIQIPEDDTRPILDLAIQGENIPLVRRPGVVLRSDLDLHLVRSRNDEVPMIKGEVHLKNSLYLKELQALAPGKVSQPENRPPYFSVEKEPFSTWKLDVDVSGEKFLMVRTPVFRGMVSTTLELSGTLEEPIALGEARINSGSIIFPFSTFEVDHGLITLLSEDPYQPRLQIVGNSRSLGYNLRMEVTGTADTPVMEFNSTPPLASEEILLMVTAGQMPRNQPGFSPEQRASRLALFLGRNLINKLGFDEVVSERLTIRSGEDIAVGGRQTYYLEYKLSEEWSLEAEYDRFSDINAGVKWKVFSK